MRVCMCVRVCVTLFVAVNQRQYVLPEFVAFGAKIVIAWLDSRLERISGTLQYVSGTTIRIIRANFQWFLPVPRSSIR